MSPRLGKLLYALLFVVLLPLLLWAWARGAAGQVRLPPPGPAWAGRVLAAVGGLTMLLAMATLTRHGEGLPMNAYPPRRLVVRGLYALTPHPIYAGFCVLCLGAAMATGSGSGFWLVGPAVVLGCAALVLGFEGPALDARFGRERRRPLLRLPAAQDGPPTRADRASAYVLVLLPWLLLYGLAAALGTPRDALDLGLPFERGWPVVEEAELPYASLYLWVLAVPCLARSGRDLRLFCTAGLVATLAGSLCFAVLPVMAPPRPFEAAGPLGRLLQWERLHDTPMCAFPSFHAAWAILAAGAASPRWKPAARLWAALVVCACAATGMHTLADVAAGALLGWGALRAAAVWEFLRSGAERVANSWREWRLGPLRIISHGFWAGLGVGLGVLLMCAFTGGALTPEILLVVLCGLAGAGLWAQLVEGSPQLLRPYGYYGGVLGTFAGVLAGHLISGQGWLLLGAAAVAGPVIQGLGRVRCLVQGCCHGRVAPASVGIRYVHPRSRVSRLSGLRGLPLHPSPLYSILWNGVTWLVLLRLWRVGADLPFIAGAYLVLNSLGRFAEEGTRGEPQTPVLGGLRLYQWVAVPVAALGAVFTCLGGAGPAPGARLDGTAFAAALGAGLCVWLALGADFPESNRRFSRLA